MEKIINFDRINKYFCTECKGFHKKRTSKQITKMRINFSFKYPNKQIKIPLSKFDLHQEFAYKLTNSELWKMQLKKSCKKYDIEKHKKSGGSKKQ